MKKKPAGFRVVKAVYGISQEHGADVTAAVQKAATPEGLVLKVSNENLGGDPHPNRRKRLWVTFKSGAVKGAGSSLEGTTLRLGPA